MISEKITANADRTDIYENKFEKIVYNVENDLSQNAIDAVDVLTQTPLLDVDIEGNVSLRGENDIKFLINGKESSFLKNGSPLYRHHLGDWWWTPLCSVSVVPVVCFIVSPLLAEHSYS